MDIRRFEGQPQKYSSPFMVISLYNLYIFVWIQHSFLANMFFFVLDPSNIDIKR